MLFGKTTNASGPMRIAMRGMIQPVSFVTVILDQERMPLAFMIERSSAEKAVPASRSMRSGAEMVRRGSEMVVWPSEMVACASGTEVARIVTVAMGFERVTPGVEIVRSYHLHLSPWTATVW